MGAVSARRACMHANRRGSARNSSEAGGCNPLAQRSRGTCRRSRTPCAARRLPEPPLRRTETVAAVKYRARRIAPSRDHSRLRRQPRTPVSGADQASRRVADRVHRGHRHVPGGARHSAAGAVVFGTLGIALVAGAAAAINCLVEQNVDKLMRRTRWRPLPQGQLSSRADAGLRRHRRRGRARDPLSVRQCVHDVAHLGDVRGLCDRLHGAAQAGDAAEHRDRWRVGRDAAGARLGRRDRSTRPPRHSCCF